MQKKLILSAAEKEQRRQIIEQNRQRRDQSVKIKSLALVSINIHHKRVILLDIRSSILFILALSISYGCYVKRRRKMYRLTKLHRQLVMFDKFEGALDQKC